MVATHQHPSGNLLSKMRNFPERSAAICSRCQGLLVKTFCISPAEGTAGFQIELFKCLQCGNFFDDIILENRWHSEHHRLIHHKGARRL